MRRRTRQEEVLARRKVLPVWCLADEYQGRPAVKVFVHDEAVQCLRLHRVVQKHPAGYAAYRPGEDTPFLVAKDMNDAMGLATEVKTFWKDDSP